MARAEAACTRRLSQTHARRAPSPETPLAFEQQKEDEKKTSFVIDNDIENVEMSPRTHDSPRALSLAPFVVVGVPKGAFSVAQPAASISSARFSLSRCQKRNWFLCQTERVSEYLSAVAGNWIRPALRVTQM